MKKTIMAFAAAMMMSANLMAQDGEPQQVRQPRQMDNAEMTKQRTEQMVKEYGLDEEQAKKLLDLNTQYAEKLPPMMMGRGQRGGMRGNRPQARGERPQGRGERPEGFGQRPQRPEQGDSMRRAERRPGGMGGRMQFNPEEMTKNMEAYNAELEKILTPEQYAKYKEEQGRRMQRFRNNGQRPQRAPQQQQEQQQ